MKGYLHPDENFQWRRRGQVISENEKYNITFTEGLANQGQNGGNSLVPSKFSSLTIRNVEISDEGTYTCFISGTDEAVDLELLMISGSAETSMGMFISCEIYSAKISGSALARTPCVGLAGSKCTLSIN